MRNLAIFPLLCLCLVSRAGTVDPTYTFSDFTDHPLNVSRVTLTPLARDAYYSGSILSTKPLVYTKAAYPTLTNGTFTATNLVNGYAYRVEIADSYQTTTVTNYFGTNVTGSVDAVDYLTPMLGLEQGVVVRAFFESAPAETGSATNVFFLASTNITPSTSGGSNVFTVTGQVPLATVAVTATNGPSGYRLDDGIAITNILDSKYNYLGVVPVSLSGGGPGGFGLKASQYGTNWTTLKMQTAFTTTNKFFTPAVGYLSNTWIVAYDPFSVWSTPTKVWAVTTSTNLVDWSPSLFVTNTQSTAQRVYIDHFFTDPDTGELFLYQSGESGITHCAKVGNTTGTNYGSWFPVETAANLGLYDASVVKWNGVYYMVGSTPVSTFEVYTNVTSATNTFRLWRADSSFTSTAMESPQIVQIGSNVHRIFGQLNPSGIQKTYFFDVTNMNIPSTLPWKEVQEDGITGGRMDVQLVTGEQKRQLQSIGESLVDARPYSFIIYTNTTPSVRSVTLPSVYIGGGTAAKITWEVTAVSAKTNTSPINLADAAFFKLEQYEYMMGGIPFFGSMPMGNFILREVARPGGYNSNDWYAVVSHSGFSSTDHYYTNGPQLVLTGPTNGAVTWKVRTTVDPTTFSLNSLTTSGTIGRWSESNVVNTTFYPNVVVSDTLTRSNASIRDGASDNYLGAITENVTTVRTQNIGSSILKIVEDAGGAITYWDYSDDALNPKAFFQYTTFLGDAADGPYVAARKIFGTNIYGGGANITGLNADNIASGTVAPERLGSGSSITTKYLRGDSTWQTISGGAFTLTMNPNQFAQAGGTTNIKSGATATNINQWGNFVLRSEDASNDITVTNHSQKLKINSTADPYAADTEVGEDIKARTFYGVSNNITGGISAGSITVGTSPTKITLDGSAGAGGFADTVYPTNVTASRMAFIGPSKAITNAGASGAVPINADGSASTSAQIGSLFTGGSTYLKADGTTGTGGGGGVALLPMNMRGQTITATGSGKNWPADMSYVSSSTSIYRTAVPAGTYTNFIGFWNAASSAGTNFWFNCQTNGVTAFAWNLGGTGGSGVSTQLIGGFTLTARGTINWVITNNSAGDFDGASFYGTYQYTP